MSETEQDFLVKKLEESRKNKLDFFEQIFVDAFIGDIPKTLSVLEAAGVKISQGYAKKIYSQQKVKTAIKARGDHPIRTELILNVEELQVFWTQLALNSYDDKIRLKSSELLGKSQGAFIEKKEITLKNHEAWLDLINSEGKDATSDDAEDEGFKFL